LTRVIGGRLAAALAIGLLAALASMAPADEGGPVSANLDSDPDLERVVPVQICESFDGKRRVPPPVCGDQEFPRHRIVIEDTCNGAPYTRDISSLQDTIYRLRVINADGATQRPEIFFDARSGATGRGGEIRVVRYDPISGSCWKPLTLFRYPTRATLGLVPRGAAGHDSFGAQLGNFSGLYKGREIRMSETYVDSDDAFCCPSFRRVTFFRYKAAVNRYVRYQTRVKRIKSRSQKP
jgi:hypothetical protein